MPVPKPNLYPDFNIVRHSHVDYVVTDLAKSRAFWADMFGLQVTGEDAKQVYLRAMEERGHHSIILTKGDTPTVRVLGFKVYSEADLDKAKTWFEACGRKTEWVARAHQGRTLLTSDPYGVPLEFFATMETLLSLHQAYGLYRGCKPLRIDHVNLFSQDVDGSVAFYNDMGFRLTEYTEDEASKKLWAGWMARKGTVHDIAFTNGFGPRLHHVAFFVPTPMSVIDFMDIISTTGHLKAIERGPGRHGIANAFFLYILDPDGHRIELYCSDYQTVDPDHQPIKWDLKNPQRQTLWGAPAPKSWFEQGALFEGVATSEPKLKAQPIVAP